MRKTILILGLLAWLPACDFFDKERTNPPPSPQAGPPGPKPKPMGPPIAQKVVAGTDHSCASVLFPGEQGQEEGGVICWGSNADGQLGSGSRHNGLQPPVRVSGIKDPVDLLVAGQRHNCAAIGKKILCWGRNDLGQLGNGTDKNSNVPTEVAGLEGKVASLAASGNHTCAVVDGTARCWGQNNADQLGGKSADTCKLQKTEATTPCSLKPVEAMKDVSQIAVGDQHTCALTTDVSPVKCWGSNDHHQLGNEEIKSDPNDPLSGTLASGGAIRGIKEPATLIAAGGNQTCALIDGIFECWGQILVEDKPVEAPTPIPGLPGFSEALKPRAISLGSHHACLAATNRGVYCWGTSQHHELGFLSRMEKVAVVTQSNAFDVAVGDSHTCSIGESPTTSGNGVQCWGDNHFAQLGVASPHDVPEGPRPEWVLPWAAASQGH